MIYDSRFRYYIRTFFELPRSYKNLIAVSVDAFAVSAAIFMTLILRNHSLEMLFTSEILPFIIASTALSILTFHVFGLYRTILRSISENALILIFVCTLIASFIWSVFYSQIDSFDIRATIILWAFLVIFIGIPRLLVRNVIKVINQKCKK